METTHEINTHLVNKDGSEFISTVDKFYHPEDIPACNPENTCEVIEEFLDEKTDELEIIKNQFDIAFKDKARLTVVRDYVNQQLVDVQKDLDAVNTTIEKLNVAYLNLKTK